MFCFVFCFVLLFCFDVEHVRVETERAPWLLALRAVSPSHTAWMLGLIGEIGLPRDLAGETQNEAAEI